jgi:CheY-like chemotaxis protein
MKAVLLVEDEQADVFIMQRAWKKAEVENPLMVVNDGRAAVDYLSGNGQYADRQKFPIPCLVLLDIKLPYLSGLQVVEWLRKYEPCSTLPAVFLTSSASDMDVDRAYQLGGNAYLVKPPTPEKLVQMLQDLKNFWMKQNKFPPDVLSLRNSAAA